MTARERVYRALQFQDSDMVPYQVNFTSQAKQKLADYLGDDNFQDKLGNHLAVLSHRKTALLEEVKPGHVRDEWGVIWNRTIDKDIGVVEGKVIPERDLSEFRTPDPKSPRVAAAYPQFVENNRDKFRIGSIGFSLFERAWSLRGMDMILMDMLEAPEFIHELLDRILEYNLTQIDIALSHDVDCVHFGDDWGSQAGLIMGPDLWREFIKPRVTAMYQKVRKAGRFVSIHSCGDVKVILPDLVESGLQVFNPFQPEVMDIFETKKRYYGKLSFYGGISVQRLLPYGTPDEVRKETKKLLDILGEGGGYIASPSHEIPPDVPPENIMAMVEVLQNQAG